MISILRLLFMAGMFLGALAILRSQAPACMVLPLGQGGLCLPGVFATLVHPARV